MSVVSQSLLWRSSQGSILLHLTWRSSAVKHITPLCALCSAGWLSLAQAGAFRVGDTAGTLDNIVSCKLYRPGSVGFVSKSGGMSNEMYNVLSRTTDGLYEGDLRTHPYTM